MKILSLIASLLLTGVVFSFSAQSGEASGSSSLSIAITIQSLLEHIFPQLDIPLETLHPVLRKGAHVMLYFLLGLSWTVTLCLLRARIPYIFLLGLMIALIDEGIQSIVPERGPSVVDVFLFDFPGYTLGSGLMLMVRSVHRRKNISS
jgi:VanZ family protein